MLCYLGDKMASSLEGEHVNIEIYMFLKHKDDIPDETGF